MNLFAAFRYLLALDEQRHFGRAALACHVTQPALSNALRALEGSLGVAIVKRGRTFEGFTSEGERVLETARRIAREHELLQQALHSTAQCPRGHLVVASVPTAMPVAARFVAMLHAQHPGIVATLRSMSSAALEAGLDTLAVDMALGYPERMAHSGAAVQALPQYHEQYVLLRRAAQPCTQGLQHGAPITWAQAAQLPLCLLTAEMHNRTLIDSAFARAGAQPQVAMQTDSILALALSVQAGAVCSVLPAALLEVVQGQGLLEVLPLQAPHVAVPVAWMVQPGSRPSRTLAAALAFAESAAWRHAVAPYGAMPDAPPALAPAAQAPAHPAVHAV